MRVAIAFGAVMMLVGAGKPDAGASFSFGTDDAGSWKIDCSESRSRCVVRADGGTTYECPAGGICGLVIGSGVR